MFERAQIADVAQVYELCNALVAACHGGDLESLLSCWREDGIQMAPGAPRRVGKTQIREAMRSAFGQFIMSEAIINTEEVKVLGSRAYSYGSFSFSRTPIGGGRTERLSGHFLSILARLPDGSWKIAIACHNHDKPTVKEYC